MKKRFLKFLVLAVALFVSVLLVAPAIVYANGGPVLISIEVTPADSQIPALGQTLQYTATGTYDDDSTADITTSVTWSSTDTSVATIDASGLATPVAEGFTIIDASLGEVINGTSLVVVVPYLWVDVGHPGETTGFSLWAEGCSGLSWALNVTGPTSYSNSGTIPSDDWDSYCSATLSEGDYTATLSVDGTVQRTEIFSVWEHEASINISPGYAGEATTFTLNATNASGATARFELWRHIVEGDYWEMDYEESIPIDSNDWSCSVARTLSEGHYGANFWINDSYEDGSDFSVVARGETKPEPVKKAKPKKKSTPIYELPITRYEKTNSGFSTLFYNRILKRAPEQAGLDAWIAGLESGTVTGADLVNRFIFGEECQSIISGYTNEEFITFLYKALFSRAPGAEGYNAWLARMSTGMTREEVVDGFTHSEEFVNLCNTFGIMPYEGYIGTTE